jgi:hypothetical protein
VLHAQWTVPWHGSVKRQARLLVVAVAVLLLVTTAAAYGQSSITLDVPEVTQKTIVWCWLAVAEMVVKYYDWDQSPKQCRILELLDGQPKGYCCSAVNRCLRTGHLVEIQRIIRHYAGERSIITGPPRRPSDLAKALRKKKLVIAAISAGQGAGHVVVVRGIRRNRQAVQLLVNDPMSRIPQTIDYEKFLAYWQETIIVQHNKNDTDDNDDADDEGD